MPTRTAACPCGQLTATCTGEPVRISVCHCHDCQRRSGSAFAVQARFQAAEVHITGQSRSWTRTSDSGNTATFHFCPICGTTLWFEGGPDPALIAIPVGTFADNSFPPPQYTVYDNRRHPWLAITGDAVEIFD